MEIIGYIGAIFIGVSLGLIGGGGSILTVPVLVYLFAIDPVIASAYSLFIVGTTSGIGSFRYFKKGLVNLRMLGYFGIPSIIAVFLTRAYLVPAIPIEVMRIGSFTLTKGLMIMVLFAVLMLPASYSMIKKDKSLSDDTSSVGHKNRYLIIVIGLVVGFLTGLVGAGGGFLIIPVLVVLSKLPMKTAVGTSLAIISAKSLIGFLGEIAIIDIDWLFIVIIAAFAIVGIFLGMLLSLKIDGKRLKPAFGWFVLIMGIYVLYRSLVAL